MQRNRTLAFWLWLMVVMGVVGLVLLSACVAPTPVATPTPTRTPKPPTPTLTPSPTPSPTPAFPVTVACIMDVPEEACRRLMAAVQQDPVHFAWSPGPEAEINLSRISFAEAEMQGLWLYAVAAPFFTVQDDVTVADVQATWQSSVTGTLSGHPLIVTTDTLRVFTSLWGTPGPDVLAVSPEQLLPEAEAQGRWALLPFSELTPKWKALRVDGVSLLEKGRDLQAYPLQIPLYLGSARRPETLPMLPLMPEALTNRNAGALTVVAMTGVTAMTRGTGQLMDRMGATYPARDILPWFEDADFVHVSNEVSFRPDCVAEGSGTMSFCSNDSYIALLEAIHTNIIELTGNHLEDKGNEWMDHSLDMYRERGWKWFGGGANQAEGARPLTVTQGVNQIAFIGCNTVGPFADETSGGAARCDFEQMRADIQALRAQGYSPIVTLQYLEAYEYFPTPQQIRDFRYLAEAGAVMVQGSQAHQAQTMEFYGDTFIHYGPGNFFFDQMWSDGTRQEFVTRLTFYENRLLSVDLRTAILEEYGRPRPMTVGDPDPAGDRQKFLQMLFELRPQ